MRADLSLRRAVPLTERYPAWIWVPRSDRKPLVTLRNMTEGADLALGYVVGRRDVAVGEEAFASSGVQRIMLAAREPPDGHGGKGRGAWQGGGC